MITPPQPGRVERKLAAIFAADVAGYSRLMSADETGTLRALTSHREIMDLLIVEHRGRIANTAGDSVLAEFPSVVDAVECAVAVQEKLGEANAGVPEDKALRFRIGVHVGDVMVQGGDLLGDGVNIAARVQALADPGGVWLSEDAHRQVIGKVGRSFDDRGEQRVKNIARPVRVFALVAPPSQPAQPKVLPLPDKPSIAVLPFTNMSGDPEQEYFCDGLVEDIITALSRVRSFFVIAGDSSFTYKRRVVDVRQISRELGVRYILQGSIRRSANEVRVTGQLVDALTGRHVWSDRFEGNMNAIFDLQDEITSGVVSAIEPRILSSELERANVKPTDSLNAYELFLKAWPCMHEFTQAGFVQAEKLLTAALQMDPRYSDVWATLADCNARQTINGYTENWEEGSDAACSAALRAVDADPENGRALSVAAWNLALFAGKYEHATELATRALKIHPNSAYVQTNCGWAFTSTGETGDALACFVRARRMNPLDPRGYLTSVGLAFAHLLARDFEDAERWTQRALDQRPNFAASLRFRAAALAHLSRIDEAKSVTERLLKIQPNTTIRRASRACIRYRDQQALYLNGLRLAGVPE
jgi:adenylate cyclase